MFPWCYLPACIQKYIVDENLGSEYDYQTLETVHWKLERMWTGKKKELRHETRKAIEIRKLHKMHSGKCKVIGKCAACDIWLTKLHDFENECYRVKLAYLSKESRLEIRTKTGGWWKKHIRRGEIDVCINCSWDCSGCSERLLVDDLYKYGLCFECNTSNSPPMPEIHFPRISDIDGGPCCYNGCNTIPCKCVYCILCNNARIPKHVYDMTKGVCINCK